MTFPMSSYFQTKAHSMIQGPSALVVEEVLGVCWAPASCRRGNRCPMSQATPEISSEAFEKATTSFGRKVVTMTYLFEDFSWTIYSYNKLTTANATYITLKEL